MRINWFSPLPPARTDIGNYTARVLPHLSDRAKVTLWCEQDEWDSQLSEWADVRRYSPSDPPWQEFNRADASVYHIGNDHRYHSAIWRIGRALPGVVVLHDYCLHEFFINMSREVLKCRNTYLDQMELGYGAIARREGLDVWEGRLPLEKIVARYPLTHAASGDALGAIVHTKPAFDALRGTARWPVFHAELPYPTRALKPRDRLADLAARDPNDPYRLIVFGFLGGNRCVDKVLQGLASFRFRNRFRLDIYGQHFDPSLLNSQVQRLGIAALVRQHGFVPETELEDALTRADLAINLRFPTMGEASGSQLRIWDHALPSLVTQLGWYESLPAGTVGYVRPGHEETDLHMHFSRLLANPCEYIRIGQRGRERLASSHSPDGYAHQVSSFVAEATQLRVNRAARSLARRAGAEMGRWLAPGRYTPAYNSVAQSIHELLSPSD